MGPYSRRNVPKAVEAFRSDQGCAEGWSHPGRWLARRFNGLLGLGKKRSTVALSTTARSRWSVSVTTKTWVAPVDESVGRACVRVATHNAGSNLRVDPTHSIIPVT